MLKNLLWDLSLWCHREMNHHTTKTAKSLRYFPKGCFSPFSVQEVPQWIFPLTPTHRYRHSCGAVLCCLLLCEDWIIQRPAWVGFYSLKSTTETWAQPGNRRIKRSIKSVWNRDVFLTPSKGLTLSLSITLSPLTSFILSSSNGSAF